MSQTMGMPGPRRSGRMCLRVVAAGTVAVSLKLGLKSLAMSGTPKHRTFEWMQWSPPAEHVVTATLDEHFPHSLPGGAIVPSIARHLRPLGVVPGDTLFGESVCADEINNGKEDLTNEMIRYWGNVFPLGGIGGAPFVGKVGFGAFSGHVPDGGNIFILFGPHVGITPEGQVGSYHRHGQSKPTSACGALIGGFNMLKAGKPIPTTDMDDIEEAWICHKLAPYVEEIDASPNPMVSLVDAAYTIIEEQILKIVHTRFSTGSLVLLGGIQINMPKPYQDHFQPRYFKVHSQGKPSIDLMKAFN